MASTSSQFIAQISFLKTNFSKTQLLNFPTFQPG